MTKNQRLKMFQKKQKFARLPENYRIIKRIKEKITTSTMKHGEWMTPEIKELLSRARKFIGYSDTTVSIDIMNALFKASRS